MKIEKKVVIDGKPCTQIFQKGDNFVFQTDNDEIRFVTLFFVKGETVLFKQEISADCGQNEGYISSIDFEGVN